MRTEIAFYVWVRPLNPLLIVFLITSAGVAATGSYVMYDKINSSNPTVKVVPETSVIRFEKPDSMSTATKTTGVAIGKTEDVTSDKVTVIPVETSPSFDIVRVEKSGDALIAGQATPFAEVAILNAGEVIAETRADKTGAFVALPDKPLEGNNNEIAIRTTTPTGKKALSGQRLAIAIPEKGQPLVAIVEPGKAIALLQLPEAEEETQEQATRVKNETIVEKQVAHVEELAVPVEVGRLAKVEETRQQPDQTVKLKPQIVAPESRNLEETIAAKAVEAPVVSPVVRTRRIARIVKKVSETNPVKIPTSALGKPIKRGTPVADAAIVQTIAKLPETLIIAPVDLSGVKKSFISVEAVEVEGQKIFIAGAGKPKETVRVYLDNESLGDTKVGETGRFLLEERKSLEPGKYSIRVDQIKSSTGQVAARAEVPFIVEDQPVTEASLDEATSVIIRHNDNLWTIAQRLYGDGRRFSAIYTKNRTQIRNPNVIFPGQVFNLPKEGLKKAQGPALVVSD